METDCNTDFIPAKEQPAETIGSVHKRLSEQGSNEGRLVSDERYEELKKRMRELLNKN